MVKTYMARDALPVEGALVRVESIDEGVGSEYHSRLTDADGISGIISLSAPPSEYSLSPGAAERPYSSYKVTVLKDGYYPKVISGVAIFDGKTTFLPVNMLLSGTGEAAPRDTLDSESYENQRLE